MDFLPSDYTAPKSTSSYMKLQDGENRFRILSKPIIGWEEWVDNKPIRYRHNERPLKSQDPNKAIKHFWAFIVWNYSTEEIEILQITQATIRQNIEALSKDKDWGLPYFYDIKIIKTGQQTDTKYTVNPIPHKPTDPYIIQQFNEKPIWLEALFTGDDPFGKWPHYTPGIFTKEQSIQAKSISQDQIKELKALLEECSPAYQEQVMLTIKNQFHLDSIDQLTPDLYERLKTAALKKRAEFQAGL